MYRLRLSDGRGQTVVFDTYMSKLRSNINQAYIVFCENFRHHGVVLEIRHKVHGWQPVYDQRGYCRMVKNPLNMDYSSLRKDIFHTLYIVDCWPSQKQWLSSESERKVRERDELAQSRRKAFKVVGGTGL